jgi:hypothetical protein
MLRTVVNWLRRLSAFATVLALAAGNVALCAGWSPTPEARMACCTDGDGCPMHKGESHHSHSARVITQAQADMCCASSEQQQSNQSSPTFVTVIPSAVLGPSVIVPAPLPELVVRSAWRTSAPIPIGSIPKHVLLSVFLV